MKLTASELNRATLARQLLLEREQLAVAEATRRVVGLQAQTPASPYLALWNRIANFDASELDRMFTDGVVVKANPLRLTLHAVHVDDYLDFREATDPSLRAAKLGGRFMAAGHTVADAAALVPRLLEFVAEPRTARECEKWLHGQVESGHAGAWWGLRQYAPLIHVPNAAPWSFGNQPTYRAPRTVPALLNQRAADAGLQVLARRYLQGFGPASAADLAQFALVPRARARKALLAITDELEQFTGPGGQELFDVPDGLRPDGDAPAPPRLMAMWDNILLAYADRSRVIPPDLRRLVTRMNGDVLPTLLVDGHVAGVWRAVEGGIEATAFHHVSEQAWADLAAEAEALVDALADRDAQVYRRYEHWWAKLPAEQVRILPG
ncbi:MAG TPA: winged helix DNA-binding domain-containing protein [Actinoplanes sp.]